MVEGFEEKVETGLTDDRHAAQWSNEGGRGKAVGCKVAHLAHPHEDNATPPEDTGVVWLGTALGLPNVGVLL